MSGVRFTRESAKRIADVVRTVELGDRDAAGLRFGSAVGDAGRKTFRIATFSGAWAINSLRTVTFKYQTATPNTAVVSNLVVGMDCGTATCDISIAREGTAWFLVQPNLTQQPGYSASGTQVLTVVNGVLRWIGTTAC